MKRKLVYVLLFVAPFAMGREDRPCADDVKKFCSGKRDFKAISQCLKQHSEQLSPKCRDGQVAFKKKIFDFVKVCGNDIRSWCAETSPGGGRIFKCLLKNREKLSRECNASVGAVRNG